MNVLDILLAKKLGGSGSGGGATIEPVIEPLTISENGTYTAPDGIDGYSPVTVSVVPPESDIDEFITRNVKNVSSAEETVGSYAFSGCRLLESVNMPNAKTISQYAFYMDSSGSKTFTVNFPEVETIGQYAFAGDGSGPHLGFANFPKVKKIESYAFYKCSFLYEVYFPEVTKIGAEIFGSNQGTNKVKKAAFPKLTTASGSFKNWRGIKMLDLRLLTTAGGSLFSNDYSLIAVVLRSETLCTLSSTNDFSNCYHFNGTVNSMYNPSGLKDGYIYVPSSLIEEYKVATNWITYADQFRAIEDYTVDGTITGEIDESKVGL